MNFVASHKLGEESGLTTDQVSGRLEMFVNEGEPLARHRMNEPFDVVTETHQRRQRRSYQRTNGSVQLTEPSEADLGAWAFDLGKYGDLSVNPRGGREIIPSTGASKSPARQMANGAHVRTSTDLLDLAFFLRVSGSSKAVVVRFYNLVRTYFEEKC